MDVANGQSIEFKVGDPIETTILGEPRDGVIIALPIRGMAKIQVEYDNRAMEFSRPLSDLSLRDVSRGLRDWNDAKGRFSIRASFVETRDNEVVLEDESGK